MAPESLILPALRAQMGDWTYYITSMTLEDLVGRVTTASAVHESQGLDDMIQRSLGNRASDIRGVPSLATATFLWVRSRRGVRWGGRSGWKSTSMRLHGPGEKREIGLRERSGSYACLAPSGYTRSTGSIGWSALGRLSRWMRRSDQRR